MKSNSYKMQNKRFVEVNQVDLVLQNKKKSDCEFIFIFV